MQATAERKARETFTHVEHLGINQTRVYRAYWDEEEGNLRPTDGDAFRNMPRYIVGIGWGKTYVSYCIPSHTIYVDRAARRRREELTRRASLNDDEIVEWITVRAWDRRSVCRVYELGRGG